MRTWQIPTSIIVAIFFTVTSSYGAVSLKMTPISIFADRGFEISEAFKLRFQPVVAQTNPKEIPLSTNLTQSDAGYVVLASKPNLQERLQIEYPFASNDAILNGAREAFRPPQSIDAEEHRKVVFCLSSIAVMFLVMALVGFDPETDKLN